MKTGSELERRLADQGARHTSGHGEKFLPVDQKPGPFVAPQGEAILADFDNFDATAEPDREIGIEVRTERIEPEDAIRVSERDGTDGGDPVRNPRC